MNTFRFLFFRELRLYVRRPLLLCAMIVAPLACLVYFTTLMRDGLPTDLPTGIVDEDDTQISRTFIHTLDALQSVDLKHRYANFSEARNAIQRGEIYGFYYIPPRFTDEALASRQPRLSFYTNETFFIPSALVMKDMKQASELASIVMMRTSLRGKGVNEENIMPMLQPIVVDTHPLRNSYLNYSVFLVNIFVPGAIVLLCMLCAAYTIGLEWKRGIQRRLFRQCGYSVHRILIGKLLPQTLIFTLVFITCHLIFYHVLRFPCHSGLLPMFLLGLLTVLAAQSFAVFVFGILLGQMRMALSVCALYGVFSFSMSGLTFPVSAMDTPLQILAWGIPLRHYYVLYVNQALNGYPATYAWQHITALLCFLLLPLLVNRRYRLAFLKYKYKE